MGSAADLMTRWELAEFFGVAPVTIKSWEDAGMPCVEPKAGNDSTGPSSPRSWEISKRGLARAWKVHSDTLSKWMAMGLGAAINRRGPRGEVFLDRRIAERWKQAYDGRLNALVLEDFSVCAAAGVFALHALSPMSLIKPDDETDVDRIGVESND